MKYFDLFQPSNNLKSSIQKFYIRVSQGTRPKPSEENSEGFFYFGAMQSPFSTALVANEVIGYSLVSVGSFLSEIQAFIKKNHNICKKYCNV